MPKGWVHTVFIDEEWLVDIEGEGAISYHLRKEEAVDAGRALAMARRTEHLIHETNGLIDERHSYGPAPA